MILKACQAEKYFCLEIYGLFSEDIGYIIRRPGRIFDIESSGRTMLILMIPNNLLSQACVNVISYLSEILPEMME